MMPLNIVLIVRRYGPVGGMERYVWEMSREMAELGHRLTILCEQLLAESIPGNIDIIELGLVTPKPRWLAHLRFSARVSAWLAAHPEKHRIIHSHERTGVHQFTTFHGPPFAAVKNKPWWQRISPRIYANLWLERRELYGPQVKAIIPNSPLIADALRLYYPSTCTRLTTPITPGVGEISPRLDRHVPPHGGVIGFVGKEWKRKGLDIAVQIVAEVRKQRPDLIFKVVGPDPDEINHLFQSWDGGFQLLGETDATPLYASFDLLLHPARQEPYGMVIAEARAAGVPVAVSDACGIAPELDATAVLTIDVSIQAWAKAVNRQIGAQPAIIKRDWKTVAEEQIEIYRHISPDSSLLD
ncbi:MAG: glycosyltransferase family 4 protein [Mariprofundus sp.]|nr:glycosyltransferase family 4 protein [Mariprofundus sp.]